jgi:uncharacterized membrane protein
MASRESVVVSVPRRGAVGLWAVALLCFGAGDVMTTTVGLRMSGVVELHPLAAHLFRDSGLGAMIALKTAVFGGCYLCWKRVPEPHSVGVPLGLAILGVAVVAWNVRVLVLATVL